MRRTSLFIVLGLLLSVVPAGSAPAHETGQEVIETIIAPPLPAKNVSRGGRSLVILSKMAGLNGIGGYYFEPAAETLGAPFQLKPAGKRDVDVFFYETLGDLAAEAPIIVGEHAAENANGEKGIVPPTTKLVVIYYGTCADCIPQGGIPAAVSFAYRAELTPVVTLAPGLPDLGDVEVHNGGSVYFDNPTDEAVSVQALSGNGKTVLFGAEAFTGKTLVDVGTVGPGEYRYQVSNGASGTVTVVA